MVTAPDSGIGPLFLQIQRKLLASMDLAAELDHPGAIGDEQEVNWAKLFEEHLPQRYQVITKCKVADHLGQTSDEIDIAICDRQYSTLVVKAESRQWVPAEAVYAVFEVKPRINREHVLYAAGKVASVRRLARTSAPIVHAGGRIDEPKTPSHIIGGLLTTGSDWSDGLGSAFESALIDQPQEGRLDIGCVLKHGGWTASYAPTAFSCSVAEHAAVSIYLSLLQALQEVGTVTAMDYSKWGAFLRVREESV